jgi:hypothetical protein
MDKKMKFIISIFCFSIIVGCQNQIDPETAYREKEKLFYINRPDYREQMRKTILPNDYSIEKKLLLIAHGFDPNVRLCLAAQFSREIEENASLKKEVITYLNSDDPALAWSAAWLCDKCLADSPDPMPTFRREDVREFENKYQQ